MKNTKKYWTEQDLLDVGLGNYSLQYSDSSLNINWRVFNRYLNAIFYVPCSEEEADRYNAVLAVVREEK